MDSYERAKMAGAVSVLADVEMNPIRKTQLVNLMSSLQTNKKLSPEEKALLEDIEFFSVPYF
ncbi:MAG: hypothetical protein ACOYVD_03470 [Bacillota bacterium]